MVSSTNNERQEVTEVVLTIEPSQRDADFHRDRGCQTISWMTAQCSTHSPTQLMSIYPFVPPVVGDGAVEETGPPPLMGDMLVYASIDWNLRAYRWEKCLGS